MKNERYTSFNLTIFLVLGNTQGDQKISVHLMITTQKEGAQILFDHPVLYFVSHLQ